MLERRPRTGRRHCTGALHDAYMGVRSSYGTYLLVRLKDGRAGMQWYMPAEELSEEMEMPLVYYISRQSRLIFQKKLRTYVVEQSQESQSSSPGDRLRTGIQGTRWQQKYGCVIYTALQWTRAREVGLEGYLLPFYPAHIFSSWDVLACTRGQG